MTLRYNTLVSIGADPEFFFRNKKTKEIVEAQDIIPDGGLVYEPYSMEDGSATSVGGNKCRSKIVIDGLQAELNPRANTCRANFGNEVRACFVTLKKYLKENHPDIDVDFAQIVKLSKKDMDRLSDRCKEFGCAPSYNVYEDGKSKIGVDPRTYMYRSAGGHLHLGTYGGSGDVLGDPKRIVPMLDIIVGNTCTILDRDPGNKERRKVYGRAGEYRKPSYGIEYRTLSNFWLRRYQLLSMVTGLARLAVSICAQSRGNGKENYEKRILDAVNIDEVRTAINRNNARLAYANWLKIEPIILEAVGDFGVSNGYPLETGNIVYFRHFLKKGLKHWFKRRDAMEHWSKLREGHGRGFESFLAGFVKKDYDKSVVNKKKSSNKD